MVAQGLNVFRTPVPAELVGRSLADAHVRRRTGCNVVAIERDGELVANPDADATLPAEPGYQLEALWQAAELYEQAIHHHEGMISHLGPLVVRTGHHTGRP